MNIRKPQVAGRFYPGNKKALSEFLDENLNYGEEKKDALGVIMPHAGYIYSGKTAARTISKVNLPDTVIVIGPNHTGAGEPFALMAEGVWETPLGEVPIDEDLAGKLLDASDLLADDQFAHAYEHSIEVELPFLKKLNENIKIVPICVGTHSLENARQVGEATGKVLKELGREATIIASSDMTHYESAETAEAKDKHAIDAILALDENALAEAVKKYDITMCGYVPAYIMLVAAKQMGASKAELVEYTTSGEVSGDFDQVVGYAGFLVS